MHLIFPECLSITYFVFRFPGTQSLDRADVCKYGHSAFFGIQLHTFIRSFIIHSGNIYCILALNKFRDYKEK